MVELAIALLGWLSLAGAPIAAQTRDAGAALTRAIADFEAGRIADAVAGFDRVAQIDPAHAPELWQRGIALYYAGQYGACRTQFESHRTVNPDDVENAAWHFLCVARQESAAKARAALLPVGPDPRRPMAEVYQMFRGTRTPDEVLAAGRGTPSGEFYAQLYVGLYYEATGDAATSREAIARAAAPLSRAGGYMHMVARVHQRLRSRR